MTTRKLTSEIDIPLVGFGTYLIKDDDASDLVFEALKVGYRHIDTAEGYNNETGCGKAINRAILELGLTRKDIFVTTKLWPGNSAWGQTPKNTETTIEALNKSLERLNLDYVDLYLIHAPYDRQQRLEQWRGLIELQKSGKTRAIGVSNFNINHIEELREEGLQLPNANQIELHPWSQKPELVNYLLENDITPIAYSSLVPLSTWRHVEGQSSGKTDEMKEDSKKEDSPFKVMATKYGVTESQLLLRWGVQKGYPVLPKSSNRDRIKNNLDLFSFSIDSEDMDAIEKMDRGDGVAWAMGDPLKNS